MNHNRHITLENSNIIVKYTNERIIPASGLAVVGALLGKSNFTKKLNHMDVTKNRSQHQIKNGDIILVQFPTAWYLWTLMLRLWTIQRLDNSPMERYFNTLKTDLIYQHHYRTEKELYAAIEEFAYVHYNHVRPHAYNKYKTPYKARYGVK